MPHSVIESEADIFEPRTVSPNKSGFLDSKTSIQRSDGKKTLLTEYDPTVDNIEIGIDEAGRGPLFGRLYVAAVVLPKGFYDKSIRDSKKFTSKKKLNEVAQMIKSKAVAWHIEYIEHDVIDEINIRQAVFRGMHKAAREIMREIDQKPLADLSAKGDYFLLVDGNDFEPLVTYNESAGTFIRVPFTTVEKGDGTYQTIAAASILAKDARDAYIGRLCEEYPELSERYGIDRNMGYGTARHLEGIREYGITQWHRRTFGNNCKTAELNPCREPRFPRAPSYHD